MRAIYSLSDVISEPVITFLTIKRIFKVSQRTECFYFLGGFVSNFPFYLKQKSTAPHYFSDLNTDSFPINVKDSEKVY